MFKFRQTGIEFDASNMQLSASFVSDLAVLIGKVAAAEGEAQRCLCKAT